MDPIAHMLTLIRNAQAVKKPSVIVPFSKIKLALLEILKQEGFVVAVHQTGRVPADKKLEIVLRYNEQGQPAITNIKRISKVSQRVYLKYKQLQRVRQGFGVAVVSTPKGLMTNEEARKQHVGGEIICEVY